jgi:hypothetical protein
MNKKEYRKRHLKVVEYIYREYGLDFHFNKTKSGTLLIQLSPIDKHYFHLLIKTFATNTKDSINNIAAKVINQLHAALFGRDKHEQV